MKTITLKSGRQTTYDDTFQPGDLITTYHSGIHQFVRYEERSEGDTERTPLVFYKQVYKFCGKSRKSKKEIRCDAAYCRRASEYINNRLKEIEEEKVRLNAILESTA